MLQTCARLNWQFSFSHHNCKTSKYIVNECMISLDLVLNIFIKQPLMANLVNKPVLYNRDDSIHLFICLYCTTVLIIILWSECYEFSGIDKTIH